MHAKLLKKPKSFKVDTPSLCSWCNKAPTGKFSTQTSFSQDDCPLQRWWRWTLEVLSSWFIGRTRQNTFLLQLPANLKRLTRKLLDEANTWCGWQWEKRACLNGFLRIQEGCPVCCWKVFKKQIHLSYGSVQNLFCLFLNFIVNLNVFFNLHQFHFFQNHSLFFNMIQFD